jgi:flagellar basal-body rod modification protein FlgD
MELTDYNNIPGLRTVLESTEDSERTELGQDEFLQLMTTQLSNQDPFEPMDNGEFLAQIAQFGTVNGVNELNDSFNNFATGLQSSQALQAATLVGREVLVNHNEAYLSATQGMSGGAELSSAASDVVVNVYDTVGQVIGRVDLGAQPSGLVQYNWDGVMLDGQRALPGRYRVEVEATRGGNTESLSPLISANVVSLTLGAVGQEMSVELENLGPVAFSQVNQIK